MHSNYAVLVLTNAELGYQKGLKETAKMDFSAEDFAVDHKLARVGAGLGGGFGNTKELRPMKYKEAMVVDREGWATAVEEEHNRMVENYVWQPVKRSKVPRGANILTSTWACKLKSNGTKRARINGRGYKQVDGVHYNSASIHSPFTKNVSVRIVLVLALMARWIGRISDVKGAFLKGNLETDKDQMFLKVPEGFEKFYEDDVVLQLVKAIYGTKQAAIAFWKELLKCMKYIKNARNGAYPCLYFKWTLFGLVVWLSWVDDCMVWGPKEVVPKDNKEFMKRFECDDVGEVKEYFGCKLEKNEEERSFKFTQPVLLQSFSD